MPVTEVSKDADALTMTLVADFGAPVQRLWAAYTDPRQLEKFWGPPGWPATFVRHDVVAGGQSIYYMTGPEGEKAHGYWEFLSVDEGRSFVVTDGFGNDDGSPNRDLPTMRMEIAFEPTSAGSRVVIATHFNSAADMEQLIEMGMEEGSVGAIGQLDEVLADLTSFAAGAVEMQVLSDTKVRFSRVIRGAPVQVWNAQQDPDLIQRWMLGPDGWRMTDCQVATSVGDRYRYAWENESGGEGFAFVGELKEISPHYRAVTTEAMEGIDSPPTMNEHTLIPVSGGTLLVLVITYADAEQRDAILATGMAEGMEMSYARLESVLAAA